MGRRERDPAPRPELGQVPLGIDVAPCEGGVVLSLRHPERRVNLLTLELIDGLQELIERLSTPAACRFLLLEGNGCGSFAAGADLAEIAALDGLLALQLSRSGQRLMRSLQAAPFPTAAFVDGHARGGGFDLAMACDLIGVTDSASLAHPGIGRGFFTGWGGTAMLPTAARGATGAAALMVGQLLTAPLAVQRGIATWSGQAEELRARLLQALEQLADWPHAALAAWRHAMRSAADERVARCLLELARVDTV